jgi:signal transduction histidine kinase/ligand-binding sensor domain-containing protein
MSPPIRAVVLTACAFAILSSALARAAEVELASEDYVLRTWEVDDVAPHRTVSGIAQTPDGYLWLATWGGLVRFDGVRFEIFSKKTPGLESNYVQSVHTARNGDLWIGLERGGVARKHGEQFSVIAPIGSRTSHTNWTSSFAEDNEGAMWWGLAPENEAIRWRDGQVTRFATAFAPPAHDPATKGDTFVLADGKGKIWCSTKGGGGVFDGSKFQPINPDRFTFVRMFTAKDGGMWATEGMKLWRYGEDGSQQTVALLDPVGGASEVTVLFEESNGDLWIGTRGAGLYRCRAGEFTRVLSSHAAIMAVTEDREHNLWVSMLGGGLNRLRPRHFSFRQAKHGLGKDGVVSVCEDAEGRLWFAVQDGPLVHATDATNRTFATPGGWTGGARTTVVFPNSTGGVWLGTDGSGLMLWQNGEFHSTALDEHIAALFEDSRRDLWVATMRGGLFCWRDDRAQPIPTADGLVVARAVGEDHSGKIWVGTEDGSLFRGMKDRFEKMTLPGAKPGESIRFITTDGDAMWIGALDGGLYRWRSEGFQRLRQGGGLPTDDLRAMSIDQEGMFWIATGQGLFRVARRELEAAIEGREPSLHATSFGRDDGVANVDFIFGNRNATTRTRDGHLWFASYRGALEITPGEHQPTTSPASVRIESVQVTGSPPATAGAKSLTLPPKPGPLEIRYTLPELSIPEQLRFRSRLVGFDDDWSAGDSRRVAVYTHLAPGKYHFEVAAAAADGPWYPNVAGMDIVVAAAWWETSWFRGAALLAAVIGLSWLVRLLVLRRVRARIRALEQEHALDRERARIARDMHDDLGAGLTQLALMAELAVDQPEGNDEAKERFGSIAQAARNVSGALDTIVWTVNPRNDTLARLIDYLGEFVAEYLATIGLELTLELPAEIPERAVPSDVRHHVLLAVKEALNNVAKHANARRVTVRVALDAATLHIAIVDDGDGFDETAVHTNGNGVGNLHQRMAAVGGAARIESNSSAGTSVRLSAPV